MPDSCYVSHFLVSSSVVQKTDSLALFMSVAFGKWCPWFLPPSSVMPFRKNKWWLADFLGSSVSLGGLLLCFLLCFSPALPRIPDYWVRYKLWMAMTYQESIWLPCFPGISSVLKHYWNARRGKYESIDYWIAESNNEMCETSWPCAILSGAYSPHWGHMNLSVSATPLSTLCSPSSPWCWTKMLSPRLPCYTQNCTKISWRYLMNVHTLTVTVQLNIIYRNIYGKWWIWCSTVFFPQGRPLSFKTFLIWVLISIYQGKEESKQTADNQSQ